MTDPRAIRVGADPRSALELEPVVVTPAGDDGAGTITIDGVERPVSIRWLDAARAVVHGPATTPGGDPVSRRVRLEPVDPPADPRAPRIREVVVDGWRFELAVEPAQRAALRDRARAGRVDATHGGPTEVRAIIPGRIVTVAVEPGSTVAAGDRLLVVEAMKMQNEVRAPRAGTVASVRAAAGATIEVGDVLVVLE